VKPDKGEEKWSNRDVVLIPAAVALGSGHDVGDKKRIVLSPSGDWWMHPSDAMVTDLMY
jgi:hypothetical protein